MTVRNVLLTIAVALVLAHVVSAADSQRIRIVSPGPNVVATLRPSCVDSYITIF
ncbi:MAG: hypothetical protein JSW47_17630 [Phycisphaerales bacterium]|nr:MAG: hypothetical protein JSW47_17630 [Phycisphaerales bacterium]